MFANLLCERCHNNRREDGGDGVAVQDLRGGEGDVEEVGRVVLQGEGGCLRLA